MINANVSPIVEIAPFTPTVRTNSGDFVPVSFSEQESCFECGAQIEGIIERLCFWCMQPMCWKCYELQHGQCVRCARTISLAPKVAKMPMHAKHAKPGRPERVRSCSVCRTRFSAREMRIHMRFEHPA